MRRVPGQAKRQPTGLAVRSLPADPACPTDYIGLPFRIAIPINVVQLPEGEYTVTVNGASATFTVVQ